MRRRALDRDRILETFQGLLAITGADLALAASQACNCVADALDADKVDAFLYEPERQSLVAVGTSAQPLSMLQKQLGLDVLQVANGGRVVQVFIDGKTFVTGHLHEDPVELRGVKEGLKIKSKLGVPIEIAGERRGMMMIASLEPDHFHPDDVRFAEMIVRWVATVVHRAQLIEDANRNAVEQGRRAVAEELVTVLAHDLRNFLMPIALRVEQIERRAADRPADQTDARRALRLIDRLSRLISDLLDVARIDQGLFPIVAGPVDLVPLVEETARLLATPDHEIRVDAYDHIVVAADPNRVRQCVENLLVNATQHSPRSAPVTVTIRQEEGRDGCWARLEVRDEGPGIPVDILPRVFDRYATGRPSRGLGLGLYLARRIAVAHGGSLSVESPPGQGAHFTLKLPCYRD